MTRVLAVAVVAVVASGGELGVRLASPQQTLGWVSQTWELLGLTTSAQVEAQLIPVAFQRGVISLSGSGTYISWKLEGVFFSSGRVDAFLSASFSHSSPFGLAAVRLAAGGKWGWAALNLSPFWIGTFWALLEVESAHWQGKMQWEGPPSVLTVRLESTNIAVHLGKTVALELATCQGDWTLSTTIQIKPVREQQLMLALISNHGKMRVWLSLSGGGLLLTQGMGEWTAVFSLVWGRNTQGVLELTRLF